MVEMAIKEFTESDHWGWVASALEQWHDAQVEMLKGKLSKDEREGIESGVERTGELVDKLLSKKKRKTITFDEWDDILMYLHQEVAD